MHPTLRNSIALATVALAIAPQGEAGIFGKSVPDPVTLDAAMTPAQLAANFDGTKAGLLKGGRKVLIGNQRLVIITEAVGRGEAAPGFANPDRGRASITAHYSLRNLDAAVLQGIADKAYLSLESSLRNAGFEVLPHSVVSAEKKPVFTEKAALERVQLVSIDSGDTLALMVTPEVVPVKLQMGLSAKNADGKDVAGMVETGAQVAQVADAGGIAGKAGGSLGRFGSLASRGLGVAKAAKQMGDGFAAVGDAAAKTTLARELGATILDVTYTLTFANIEASKAQRFLGNSSATVKASFQPAFVPGSSTINVSTPDESVHMNLKQPMLMQGGALSDVEDATTTADKVGNISGAVLSGLIALQYGTAMNSSKTIRRAVSVTDQYDDVLNANLALVNQGIVESLKK